MARTVAIWKYPLSREPVQTITVASGFWVRHFDLQHGTPTIWAECHAGPRDSDYKQTVTITRRATGETWSSKEDGDSQPSEYYLGTLQEGPYVWHYFYSYT